MTRHELLRELHRRYRPRSYLEIGVERGRSLALSRTRTIAVDPAFRITEEIACDLRLVRAESDDFFARKGALDHFPGGRVDLAFVDGMHLFENALRDVANVERRADWTSVIVVDDVLPRTPAEAARERGGMRCWAGDVFRLHAALAAARPDLLLLLLDVEPTGALVVLGADSESRVLAERHDELVDAFVRPDPQEVPEALLRRARALEPASLVASAVWDELAEARDAGVPRAQGWERVRRAVETSVRPAPQRELRPEEPPVRARSLRRRLGRLRPRAREGR